MLEPHELGERRRVVPVEPEHERPVYGEQDAVEWVQGKARLSLG